MPNVAPAGTSLTRSIPRSYTLHKADFGYSDADGNAFAAVLFTTLPAAGTLYYDANGALGGGRTAVAAGQAISAADILAGKLSYVAPAGVSGANYAHFTFQVRDDGGTAGGGQNTDQSPNTLTFNLVASAATPGAFGSLIDLTGLAANQGFKIQGDLATDLAGSSVSAGDINGDGFSDLILGARGNDSGGDNAGAAYVIFGKASGFGLVDLSSLATSEGFKIQGDLDHDAAGSSVSAAGDINGDGFADIIVGAYGNDSAGVYAGAAYVTFGHAGGFGNLIDLTGLGAADGFKIQGALAEDLAGISVSSAGDVNGDGFADIIVGAHGDDGGGDFAGAAYVIFGKASGFGSLISLAGLAAADGFKIQGGAAADHAGFCVSSAGDVNGDGFADVILGAYGNDSGGNNAGAAYVIFGKASGFGSLIDLSSLSASQGFKLQGDAAEDYTGTRVSSAGDVNGDGLADMLVQAAHGTTSNAAYLIFGKANGFGSIIDLSGLGGSDGVKILGENPGDLAFSSLASAGDVNGDGFADIIIGAQGNDSGGNMAGAAYVIFGHAGGFGSIIDLGNLTPTMGFKIQGDLPQDSAGISVSAAGDLNGDGFADIAVGAYGDSSGGFFAGAAYVIFGRANINTAPAGSNLTRTIPSHYALHQSDFGFSDVDGHSLLAVRITALPAAGTLYYDANGALGGGRTAVTVGQVISAAEILAGHLTYVAAPGASGANYTHVNFKVQDNGGTAGGGVDFDPSSNTLTFGIAASAATATSFGGFIDLTGLAPTQGFKIQGDLAGDYAGKSVSGAGDINGDGFADIVIGASGNGDGGIHAGAAYVIFGKASGFGLVDLSGLATSDGFRIQGDLPQDRAGYSVAGAGDVNGDGFADILVGAYGNDGDGDLTGAAYLIFGHAGGFGNLIDLSSLSAADGFGIQGDLAGDLAGIRVSSAGDVNGDGFADILVGAIGNASGGNNAGAAYLIFGKASGFGTVIDLTSLTAADGVKIQGDLAGDDAGFSVSAAGDVNGDGLADLIIGADGNDGGGSGAGAAYVIFGKSGGFADLIDLGALTSTDGFKIQGDVGSDRAGRSVSTAGDINGDGFADIIIGAPYNGSGGPAAGAAYVVFGKAGGFGTVVDLTSLAATDGFKIQGDLAVDAAGRSVSAAGDVNGDGFADILVGAYGNDSGGNLAGAAYVIFGHAGGFGSLIDLTDLASRVGFKIQGEAAGDLAGKSISAAGDVNGDGFDDIIVGAFGNGSGGADAGAAYVIFGRSNVTPPAGSDLTRTIPSHYALHQSDFGYSDADGDAFGSVIVRSLPMVGTLYYDANGELGGGRTAVVAGQAISAADILAGKLTYVAPAGFAGGEVHFTFQVRDDSGAGGGLDTDQSPNILTLEVLASPTDSSKFGSVIDLTGLSSANGFKIQGDLGGDSAGRSVASAGDVNGDGFADIIVGAPGNDSGGATAGAAYVIFGRASGFGSLIDLTGLAAANGFKIQGDLAGDNAGVSVSSAGDVNGDGFADLIVGASQNDAGGNYAGAAYVLFGKASGFGALVDLTGLALTDGFRIQGDAAGDFAGSSVTSAGDVNGDGFADILIGAYGNSEGGAGAGAAYLIFGHAGSFDSMIDLTGLAAATGFKIQGDMANDRAGISVAAAGDVNGDGFSDIIVGAKTNGSGGNYAGAGYVIFGKSGGFGSLVDLTGLAATDGFKIQGDSFLDYAGVSVSSAGDINGDGFADLLIGANNQGNEGIYSPGAGAAYVVFGKASGFGSLIDLTGLAATDGFKIQGALAADSTGFSVSAAGDVNGDGYADLLVAAIGDDGGGTDAGAAYLIFGKASGFGSLIDLASLSAADGFKILGDLAGDAAGGSVSAAGDVNGDGFADILIGASGNDAGGGNAGAAYVIYGRANSNPPVAVADAASTNEASAVTIAVLGNDTDADGGPKQVISVDGTALSAGQSVLLASGARVTLNANGTLAYNPNHAFDATPAAGSGASNMPAHDSFSYTLNGDSIATVSVTINGLDSIDVLLGTGGNDILNGGAGADRMTGGLGNDTYYIDAAGDQTIEAVGGGSDTVITNVSYTLAAGQEIETLRTYGSSTTVPVNLTGNDFVNIIFGNAAANSLDGKGGADTLRGYGGNDIYYVDQAGDAVIEAAGAGSDTVITNVSYTLAAGQEIETLRTYGSATTVPVNLTGNAFANAIVGNAAANILDGKGGADNMWGYGGNDTYYVDNALDKVTEAVGAGSDTIITNVSYTLGAGQEIETLRTNGSSTTAAINLTGNEFGQTLAGNAAANLIDGKGGADNMWGYGGNDTYYVDNALDKVTEAAGAGNDTIITNVSYTLGAGQEIETLRTYGSATTGAINLIGNEYGQTIVGNAAANRIDGRGGADTLHGYGGNDIFYFTTALGGGNVDQIADFQSGADKIALENSVFTGLASGALPASAFVTGSAAADANDRIIYNPTTGQLFFDADGNGSAAAMLFATLHGAPSISASDFVVI